MKPIIVQNQVRLGPIRCLKMSLTGMSYRMFRSAITVCILALAVAFLIHMLSYGLIAHQTKLAAYRELQDVRLLGEWVTRLSQADAETVILEALTGTSDAERLRREEYHRWSAASPEEFQKQIAATRQLQATWDYFDGLPPASRAVLVSGLTADTPLLFMAQLGESSQYDLFLSRIQQMGLQPPPGGLETFHRLVQEDSPRLSELVRRIQDGHRRACEQVKQRFGSRDPRHLLAEQPPGFNEALAAAGFAAPPEVLARLRLLAQSAVDLEGFNTQIGNVEFKSSLARELRKKITETDLAAVLEWLRSPAQAQWLASELKKQPGAPDISADRFLELADNNRRQEKLQRIVGDEIPESTEGFLSLPADVRWLIAVSFLVCAVGVANAMLMSVTERFSEIATMKCLGALNGFVMQVFFFEAVLQGMIGGVIGIVVGMALAAARAFLEFGPMAFTALPYGDLVAGAALAWLTGLLLAAAAAVGPVWVAARLAPMEAMRVE
jgi:putative ABC transport system permease protein